MQSKANAGNLRDATQEQLHQLIDLVKKREDEVGQEVTELRTKVDTLVNKGDFALAGDVDNLRNQMQKSEDHLKEVEGRLQALDKALPVGDKIYRPIDADASAERIARREEIAKAILDRGLIARGDRPNFGSVFSRTQVGAGGDGTNPITNATDALSDGGYLFNPEFRYEIIWIVQQYGVARKLCKMVKMNSKDWIVPLAGDLPEVFWDMQIDGRGQRDLSTFTTSPYDKAGPNKPDAKELYAPQEGKVVFGQRSMSAHKMIALDTLSIELAQDAIPDIAAFVLDQFAIAVAKEEDFQLLMSPGGSGEPFTGLMSLAGITDVTSEQTDYEAALSDSNVATGAYPKLVKLYDAVDESTVSNSVFVMSNSILNGTRLIRNTYGDPLMAGMIGPTGDSLLGRPITRSRVMPKMKDETSQADSPFMLFGDFNYQVMGDRMQLSFDTSKEAEFRRAGIVLRLMERISFCTLSTTPFARFRTKA